MNSPQSLKNYIISECKPPTYLKHFEKGEDAIILAHYEKPLKKDLDEQDTIVLPNVSLNNSANEKLDLTGNPLQLDLQLAEENIDVTIVNNTPNSWLKSEKFHIPLPLTDAINFLRHYNENNTHIGDGLGRKIYCVCDGLDSSKTISIGSQKSSNSFDIFELNFKGCFAKNDPSINMISMKKEHLAEVGEDVKVVCEIMSKYALSGYDLKLLNHLNDCNQYSALLLDVHWKDSIAFDFGTSNILASKLHIQTIAGHRNSPIALLWEDLLLMEKFINLLNTPADDISKLILSESYIDVSDIITQIENTLRSFSSFGKVLLQEKVEIKNFVDFRSYNGIDCFWNILKRSKQLGDVQNIFQYIFTEAARDKSLHINIPLNNNGFFANMLRGILEGTHAVPTFTPSKALECLIECGMTKLKNDYLFILDTYNCDVHHPAFEIFSFQYDTVSNKRQTTVNKRRTVCFPNDNRLTVNRHRMTINDLNYSETNGDIYKNQLYVLSGLHLSIQSILLLKEKLDMSSDAFYTTPQYVLDHYLGPNRSVKTFNELILNNLCELSLDINDIDKKVLAKFYVLHWNYAFQSVNSKTTITSTYLHSMEPIFPPCIIKNYEYPDDTIEDIYYVSRFLSIIDSF